MAAVPISDSFQKAGVEHCEYAFLILSCFFLHTKERQKMTDKNNINTKEAIAALSGIISEVLNARNTIKNKAKYIDDTVKILKDSFTNKDYDKIFKVLFTKADNTTFYNLYLSRYFKSCHFMIEYNVKKDKVFYVGDIKTIDKTYEEYLEEVKKESQEYQKSLSDKERLAMKYKSIDKLSKKDLEILKEILNSKLKKAV